jgi:hypothetical protein
MHKVIDKQDSIILEKLLFCELKPLHNRNTWGLLDDGIKSSTFREPKFEAFSEDYDLISLYEEDDHLKIN